MKERRELFRLVFVFSVDRDGNPTPISFSWDRKRDDVVDVVSVAVHESSALVGDLPGVLAEFDVEGNSLCDSDSDDR